MAERLSIATLDSPLGVLTVHASAAGVRSVAFTDEFCDRPGDGDAYVHEATDQLCDYLSGRARAFDLPLDPAGTPFQRSVWDELSRIPFGETRCYRDIARAIGKPKAVRAVGMANGRNPIAVVVPCHRVIGADGALRGFGGGVWRKEWLLAHEGVRTDAGLFSGSV